MKIRVQQQGDDLILVIPTSIARAANLQDGATVEISVVQGGLVIDLAQLRFTLEQLLEGVTEDNLHAETDTGFPVGREII